MTESFTYLINNNYFMILFANVCKRRNHGLDEAKMKKKTKKEKKEESERSTTARI